MYILVINGQSLQFHNQSSAELYFRQSNATKAVLRYSATGMTYEFNLVK